MLSAGEAPATRACTRSTATSGSIDAATSEAISIGSGFAGAIIENTRIRTAIHDTHGPSGMRPRSASVFNMATPIALAIRYPSPAAAFVSSVWFARRTYRNIAAETDTPQVSMMMANGTRANPSRSGTITVSMARPKPQRPVMTALKTASRSICSASKSSGSRLVSLPVPAAPGTGVGTRGAMTFTWSLMVSSSCFPRAAAAPSG